MTEYSIQDFRDAGYAKRVTDKKSTGRRVRRTFFPVGYIGRIVAYGQTETNAPVLFFDGHEAYGIYMKYFEPATKEQYDKYQLIEALS